MTDRCSVPGCRGEVEIVYLGHNVCSNHWNRFSSEHQPAGGLAKALGIPVADATKTEVDMSETKKTETKLKKAKAPKEPKAKREKVPNDATRVFAIRVTDAELEAIHKAAGPRNATRFVRAVAAAFAAEDESAFRAVLREARELRG